MGFPFFLAMCFRTRRALALLFWEMSHRGDSGMHLGRREVSLVLLRREDLPGPGPLPP